MKCPKCGGEIPFYDLKPNCKHCGVNIMYYTQEAGLTYDAKRTELESAAARMVIARIKANFISGKLQIVRLITVLVAVAALLIPFGGVRLELPFCHKTFSVGLIGIIKACQGIKSEIMPKMLHLFPGVLQSRTSLAAVIPTVLFFALAVLDLVIFALLLLGFLNLTKSTKRQKNAALVGVILSGVTQITVIVLKLTAPAGTLITATLGFGALAAAAVYLALFFLNRALLQKGIEPEYRENDLKRKELLGKVRAGEVSLDSLPLPVFESEDEREERLKALEEALKAEEEGKEL